MAKRKLKSMEARQFDEALGRRMQGARMASGLRCKDLAARVGISSSGLYWYESGRSSCPPMMLARIAAALGVSVTALMPKFTNCGFLENRPARAEKSC